MSGRNSPSSREPLASHSSDRGVLLVNLGSPHSPQPGDVRKYLRQFLMDERVLDVPYLLRKFIVCCLILPRRTSSSAEAYRQIWTPEGSPLLVTSRNVLRRVQEKLRIPVELGMRYGSPSIEHGVRRLLERTSALRKIFLVPLYPHYALSSYETVVVETERVVSQLVPDASMEIQPPFYDLPEYIDALVTGARPYLEEPYDHVLFSYHGLPERHLRKADPTGRHCLIAENCCEKSSPALPTCYRAQVIRTTRAFVERAGIPDDRYSISYQSRLGRDPWLQPYTDQELARLASEGVRKLVVLCPAFVADCLETLEEIGIRGREIFMEHGGEELRLVPCLNEHPRWIDALTGWCIRFQNNGGSKE